MSSVVIAELDAVLTEFRGDPERVYLGGFSMGADGTYAIAAQWPDRFAAVYAIAGFIPLPVEELAAHLRAIPIRIFHGETDESVPVEQSRQLVAALKKVGATVEYIEYADTHHGPAAEKAYAKEDFVTWLLAHQRKR
jgi:predicted peptidase